RSYLTAQRLRSQAAVRRREIRKAAVPNSTRYGPPWRAIAGPRSRAGIPADDEYLARCRAQATGARLSRAPRLAIPQRVSPRPSILGQKAPAIVLALQPSASPSGQGRQRMTSMLPSISQGRPTIVCLPVHGVSRGQRDVPLPCLQEAGS